MYTCILLLDCQDSTQSIQVYKVYTSINVGEKQNAFFLHFFAKKFLISRCSNDHSVCYTRYARIANLCGEKLRKIKNICIFLAKDLQNPICSSYLCSAFRKRPRKRCTVSAELLRRRCLRVRHEGCTDGSFVLLRPAATSSTLEEEFNKLTLLLTLRTFRTARKGDSNLSN